MRTGPRNRRLAGGVIAVIAAVALLASSCGDSKSDSGSSSGDSSAKPATLAKIGKGEGELAIIAWAGYAENGSTSPDYDWVTPFEKESGCKVTVKVGNTSDEMVELMRSGDYDGVSASGNASQRLIEAGDVSPVNTDLLTNYPDVAPFLKNADYNSKDGQMYGMPHGWGANLLQYNADVVSPAPDSWGVVYDAKSPQAGKITAYDDWTTIADAAVYLKSAQPELKIDNPYALDQKQFDAAVQLLKDQKPLIAEYWSDYLKYEEAVTKGSITLGTTWQIITNTLTAQTPPVNVKAVLPKEGSTAWSDTWMLSSKAKHPNCMYPWMNWISKPDIQAQVAEYFGEAPANLKACDLTTDKDFCTTFHAGDEAYANELYYWTVPTEKCLDGSDRTCVGFKKWVEAWTEVKG